MPEQCLLASLHCVESHSHIRNQPTVWSAASPQDETHLEACSGGGRWDLLFGVEQPYSLPAYIPQPLALEAGAAPAALQGARADPTTYLGYGDAGTASSNQTPLL